MDRRTFLALIASAPIAAVIVIQIVALIASICVIVHARHAAATQAMLEAETNRDAALVLPQYFRVQDGRVDTPPSCAPFRLVADEIDVALSKWRDSGYQAMNMALVDRMKQRLTEEAEYARSCQRTIRAWLDAQRAN